MEWVSVGDVVMYDADEYNAEEMDSCIQVTGAGNFTKLEGSHCSRYYQGDQ